MQERKVITRFLEVEMSDEKKIEIGKELSRIQLEIEEIENSKKKINPLREELTNLSRQLKNGVIEEATECIWLFDNPEVGQKTLVNRITYADIETVYMTEDEKQGDLEFKDEEPDSISDDEIEELENAEETVEEPNQLTMEKVGE